MDKQAVQAYIIDRLKTPPSNLLELTKKCNSHPAFVPVLATKIIPQKQGLIQIISPQCIQKSISNKSEFEQKLMDSYNVLRGIGLMHDNEWYIGEQEIKEVLGFNMDYGNIQILPYRFEAITTNQGQKQEKKQVGESVQKQGGKSLQTALKLGISKCFPQQCKISHVSQIDLWKWAYFTCSQLLYNGKPSIKDIFTRILAKQSLKKGQQSDILPQKLPIIKELQIFDTQTVQNFMNTLKNCLNPFPELRPTTQQMIHSIQHLISSIQKKKQHAEHFKKVYKQQTIKKINKASEQLSINIPQDQTLILTNDMKKKMTAGIQKLLGKTVKSFQALYRATLFEFDPHLFYVQCSGKNNILICIETVDNGKIFAYIAPQINLLEQNGVEGRYVVDQFMHSFIYSTKNQEFNKILVKQKAFKSVPGYGPIIGDGDIILGNNPSSNYSYFPKSFQPGKKKSLLEDKKPNKQDSKSLNPHNFSILNYDVYQIKFKK